MTMTTAIQIGVLAFMTLLPIVLSVIHYVVERQQQTKKISHAVRNKERCGGERGMAVNDIGKALTTAEGAAMIAGTGIGSGVMSIPYLVKSAGAVGGLLAFVAAFALSVFMHCLTADKVINSGEHEITRIFSRLMPQGKWRRPLELLFFVLAAFMLTANLSAYILGGAEVLCSLLPIPTAAGKLLFFAVAALPVMLGLRAIGMGEKWLVAAIGVLLTVMTALTLIKAEGTLPLRGSLRATLGVFSMLMFSLTALFAVPELARGMHNDARRMKSAIFGGLSANLMVCLLICVSAIAASEKVTKMAAVGLHDALGPVVGVCAGLFVLLAMLTSFFVLAFSLTSIVSAQFHAKRWLCFAAATLPALLAAFIPSASFANMAKVAGGIISLLIFMLLIPAYRRSVQLTGCSAVTGCWGQNRMLLACVIIGSLLMMIGALC